MYNFVKEKGDQPIKNSDDTQPVDGNVARETYEEIIRMPSTSSKTNRTSKKKLSQPLNIRRKILQRTSFEPNKLFTAASSDDLSTLEKMDLRSGNLNITDQFGWTALMMASCEGYFDVVKFLVENGANLTIVDKQNNSALSIATKKNHQKIVSYLTRMEVATADDSTICISDDSDDTTLDQQKIVPFYCDDCNLTITQSDEKAHSTSTLHRLNAKEPHTFPRHFGIPESNVGFKMLLQQGWNRKSGLGPEQSGHLYPVKTTLRKSRSGLGVRQPKTAKITHFKPFDESAIRSIYKPAPIHIVKTKKQIKAEKQKTIRKNRHLRNLLS